MTDLDLRTVDEIRVSVEKMSRETKQRILDLLRDSETIGEICEKLNLPLMDVCEVINQNIYCVHLLNEEAK